jgi:nucleoside phosphorylase
MPLQDVKDKLRYHRSVGADILMMEPITYEDYRDWDMTTESILLHIFGESHAGFKRFRNSRFPASMREANDSTLRIHLEDQIAIMDTLIRQMESEQSHKGPTISASPTASTPNAQSNSTLIVTVTKVEAQAVLEVFSKASGQEWSRQILGKKTYYNLGIHGGTQVFMVQSEMGSATPGGALLTVHQSIQALRPQAVIMCGIAFGLHPDKQQLGDILIAQQIQSYEPQKIDLQRGQMPRGDRATSSELLLDRFHSGDIEWQGAQTRFGLILSGEKLVNDPTFRDLLLKTEPEALGGEMEGAGLYVAARDAKVDWILVKAICDWADGNKNSAAQPLAAHNAAEFVLHVLRLGGLGNAG